MYPVIYLNKKKIAAVKRFHPWIFSGAIQKMERPVEDGELVEVRAMGGEFLAIGYYQDNTIAIRILSFKKELINEAYWENTLKSAYNLRNKLGLVDSEITNAYRLIHAEGDGVPGLIIDIYNTTAVIQCHSIGIHQRIEVIKSALLAIYGNKLEAIYDKSKETLPKEYAQTIENGYLHGHSDNQIVKENKNMFFVDWALGQKTGFFLDQRENRKLLAQYAPNKSVLNTFCYSGGFSIYALRAGASLVHSVDVSKKAIDWTDKNVEINGFENKHESYAQDVLRFLKRTEESYDIVVVDPPAYAKSKKARHNAVQGYKRLNAEAFKKVKNGGLMFTFSCSQVVDRVLFHNTIVAAALESKRKVRVLHHLSQPADHPMNIYHPEGSYLKGLVLQVED
ncbi:MAG: class I SAM-dependent rRNA methyltransferase [Saprospiraceae bacterium]